MNTRTRILALLNDGTRRADGDIARDLGLPEPSVRRTRLQLQKTNSIKYGGARYEPHATVQTWTV